MNLTPSLVTSVIALAAVISPMLVAIINNSQQTKLKELEFKHDNQIRQLKFITLIKKLRFWNLFMPLGLSPVIEVIPKLMQICYLHLIKQCFSAVTKTKLLFIISLTSLTKNPLILMKI